MNIHVTIADIYIKEQKWPITISGVFFFHSGNQSRKNAEHERKQIKHGTKIYFISFNSCEDELEIRSHLMAAL